MSLSSAHIPLPCSLRERVRQQFPQAQGHVGGAALTQAQLLDYLRRGVEQHSSPMMSLRRQAEADGHHAVIAPDAASLIEWVSLAFEHWQTQYPVEHPLSAELHKLLPLTVAVALTDIAEFATPGAHPLHRLLDELQRSAVGWQARLERAGQMLEHRITRAVTRALSWFDNPRLDFDAITRELGAAAERDIARVQRMVQRLAEAEQASLKTESARRQSAALINAGLDRYRLPAAIGEFLKGPWFESAQLVLLRYGTDSHEWRQLQRVTEQLMESVQTRDLQDDANRERLNQITRRLPQELREWLLSLQHDPDATDDAIGLVEYAHLRLRHGQDLGLMQISPIAIQSDKAPAAKSEHAAQELANGQWFLLHDGSGELRAQLALQLQNGDHLLFTNVVGLKAMDLRLAEFQAQLASGHATPLHTEDSFSLSLAYAAGIDSDDALEALIRPQQGTAATPLAPEPVARPSPQPEAQPASASRPQPTAEPAPTAAPQPTAEPVPAYAPRPATPPVPPAAQPQQREIPATAAAWAAEEVPTLELEAEAEPAPEPEARGTVQAEPTPSPIGRPGAEASELPEESLELSLDLEVLEADTPPPAAAPTAAAQQQPPPRAEPPPPPPPPPAPPQPAPLRVAPQPSPRPQAAPAPAAAPASDTAPAFEVPMGAWLGFHDGEMPIMAKLAVFDPRNNRYIFVNRRGIALRELSGTELQALIERDLVDILETRSYFRDEVQRARGRGD